MLSTTAQKFNNYVAQSSKLQSQIDAITSPLELLEIAHKAGFELTQEDLQTIAQNAYQQWLATLEKSVRNFFEIAHQNPEINQKLKQCRSVSMVIDLAQESNIKLTVSQIQQAAVLAYRIPGFSFEKLWFYQLDS